MDVGSAFGMFAGELVDRSVRASLLFSSALCFQRVTTASPNFNFYSLPHCSSTSTCHMSAMRQQAVTWCWGLAPLP